MKHVVMFSGGVTSWAAAKRVAERHGVADLVLLFANTNSEDEDTYRWLRDAAANVGVPLTELNDGRTIWDVFHDERFLGNSRLDPCSKYLKREPTRRWVLKHCDPAETVLYLGYDWNEPRRLASTRRAWEGWQVEAPMAEKPWRWKAELLTEAEAQGIRPQRLYQLGARHANCGGGCVKAGIDAWRWLLRVDRARYLTWEANEDAMRTYLAADVPILTDRRGGVRTPLTLRALREEIEAQPEQLPLGDDWGACDCYAEPAA